MRVIKFLIMVLRYNSMTPPAEIFSDLLEHFVTFSWPGHWTCRYLWTDVPLFLHMNKKMIFNKSENWAKPPHILSNASCNIKKM